MAHPDLERQNLRTKLTELYPSRYSFTPGGVVHATTRTGNEALCGKKLPGTRFWRPPEAVTTCRGCIKRGEHTVGEILDRLDAEERFRQAHYAIRRLTEEWS